MTRKMKRKFLKTIKIESSCIKKWSEMPGDEKMHFCLICKKNVHNLSALTNGQAERLFKISKKEIRARY